MTRLRTLVARLHAWVASAREPTATAGAPDSGLGDRRRYTRPALFFASILLWILVLYSLSLMVC